ncbi:MAG: PEP-CTERM sorting domain-containing protein [Armatimonadota bacterium]
MNRFCFIVVLCCLIGIIAMSTAQAYTNNPPFNPQRTLCWNFNSSNWQKPETVIGPIWDEGEWICDDIRTTGDVNSLHWYEAGYIGVDNTNGTGNVVVDLIFHVNNYDNNNPIKYVWDEAVYAFPNADSFNLVAPAGYETSWQIINKVNSGNWLTDNLTGTIMPNPDWEEFVWHFNVAAGQTAYLDRFCVSTLCTPEPSSIVVLLGGLGVLGKMIIRRKK